MPGCAQIACTRAGDRPAPSRACLARRRYELVPLAGMRAAAVRWFIISAASEDAERLGAAARSKRSGTRRYRAIDLHGVAHHRDRLLAPISKEYPPCTCSSRAIRSGAPRAYAFPALPTSARFLWSWRQPSGRHQRHPHRADCDSPRQAPCSLQNGLKLADAGRILLADSGLRRIRSDVPGKLPSLLRIGGKLSAILQPGIRGSGPLRARKLANIAKSAETGRDRRGQYRMPASSDGSRCTACRPSGGTDRLGRRR